MRLQYFKSGALLVLGVLPAIGGCKQLLDPFQPMTEVQPCDPAYNVYQSESHYFERDFLDVDGHMDYDKLVRINKPQASPCDPLYDPGILHYAPED